MLCVRERHAFQCVFLFWGLQNLTAIKYTDFILDWKWKCDFSCDGTKISQQNVFPQLAECILPRVRWFPPPPRCFYTPLWWSFFLSPMGYINDPTQIYAQGEPVVELIRMRATAQDSQEHKQRHCLISRASTNYVERTLWLSSDDNVNLFASPLDTPNSTMLRIRMT